LETNGDLLETQQLTYNEALEQLRAAYEHEKIVLTARISTLEVSVGQQSITIKKLQDSLEKAQAKTDTYYSTISKYLQYTFNVQTILRLQESTNQGGLQTQECHA